jgi:hypothetical protein
MEAMNNSLALEGMFSGFGMMDNAAGVVQAIDELSRLRNLEAEITFPREEDALLTFWDLELLGRIRREGIEKNMQR